jgi:hypothetical protein
MAYGRPNRVDGTFINGDEQSLHLDSSQSCDRKWTTFCGFTRTRVVFSAAGCVADAHAGIDLAVDDVMLVLGDSVGRTGHRHSTRILGQAAPVFWLSAVH